MLKARSRWQVAQAPEEVAAALHKELRLTPLVAKVLAARGYGVQEAKAFLDVNAFCLHDPYKMKGMSEAITRIQRAISRGERIRIFGDYDCDGVTSTAIMVKTLIRLGGKVDYYIPDRFLEGYGLNNMALEQAKREGVSLLITVDTGISGWEEIAYASQIGLDCIVTDHHEPPSRLPEATSVINPKQPGCPYPFKGLAGAGVALKVAQALLEEIPADLLELAAIGTIADLVPLVDENRWIATQGLFLLNQTQQVGLQKLIEQSGLAGERIDEHHVGFILAPRLNACGRLESAGPAVELLLTEHPDQAAEISRHIEKLNILRQQLVTQHTEEAAAMVEAQNQTGSRSGVLLVAQEGWHEGVLGIVAAKLVERYYRPALVLSIDRQSGLAKGSARSIDGFDLYKALEKCSQWIARFGGHPMAAGLTVAENHLEPLYNQLTEIAQDWLTEDLLKPVLTIDAVCSVEELTVEAIQELERLAPFGEGNPPPVLLVKGAQLADMRRIGKQGDHLKFLFQLGSSQTEAKLLAREGAPSRGPEAIGFGWGEAIREISPYSKVDVAGRLVVNQWNGHLTPQVHIADLRVTERQYFDWRGKGQLQQHLDDLPQEITFCYFRGEPLMDKGRDHVLISPEGEPDQELGTAQILFYDLPLSFHQLKRFCRHLKQVERLYLVFQHQDRFFSTWPTREHFKWYYAFLKQRGSFDLVQLGPKLAKHKGWTLDAITFMTDVFLELDFVTMKQGKVEIVAQPEKKSLSHSSLFRQRQEEYQLEQTLIYSPFKELIDYFSRLIEPTEEAEKLEEEKVYGL